MKLSAVGPLLALTVGACSSASPTAPAGVPTGASDAATMSEDGARPTIPPDANGGAGFDASLPDGSPIADASKATVVFSNPAATNADTSTYAAASTTSAGAKSSQTEITITVGSVVRTAVFFIETPYAAGQTYAFGSPYDNTVDQATLAYTDHGGQWYAASGTVTLESADATRFVFHVKGAAMEHAPNDKSTGTFTLTIDGPTKVN